MESGFGWTWGKKKNGFPTKKCLLFLCVIVKRYLSSSSYFQESPSYFLYSTLFEKWNVKYSDTFLVLMYVPRILPYVIVHSGTRFSFLRNHFSPTKKFANVWYFIHATFHSKSSKKMKTTKIVNIFQLFVSLPLYFFVPLVMYNPHSSRYIYILVRLLFLSLQCINTSPLPEPEMNWGSIEDKAISDSI